MESLELLSHSHFSNDLQYAASHVAPYMVVTSSRLRYLGAELAELAAIKTEGDKLEEKVWLLKDEKLKFEEIYVVPDREKYSIEDQVVSLDREVEYFSH